MRAISQLASRAGVVVPAVGVALSIMSALAVAVPWIATGAHRASRPAPAPVQSFSWADGLFPWAVFGQASSSMGGGGTDSWDSRLGPYDPATAGSDGDIVSNGDWTLTNTTIVKGDLSAGGNAFNTAGVTGTVTTHAPQIPAPPVIACPKGGYTPKASLGTLPPGVSYSSGALTVGSGANLILTGVFYYFSSVTLNGGTLTFNNSGRHVDIYLSNDLTVTGGSVVNTAALPTNLEIWGCGADANKWEIKSSAAAYLSIYAPSHQVKLSGSGDVFGAIVCAFFSTGGGGSHVHYDKALGGVTGPVYGGTFGVLVSPHATTASQLPSNGTTYPVVFTVQNTGDTLDSYDLLTKRRPGAALTTVAITGAGVTQGANPDSARLATMASLSSATVTVTYAVGNVAAGTTDTLIFTARSLGAPAESDSGRLTLTVVRPSLTMSRSVSPVGTEAPGTDLTYALTITNSGSSNAAGVAVVDTVPSAVQFKVGSVVSSPPAGVTAVVEYSKDGGATWTYVPAGAACGAPAGYDRCVNRVRWRLQQPLSSGAPNNAGTVQFVAQIR